MKKNPILNPLTGLTALLFAATSLNAQLQVFVFDNKVNCQTGPMTTEFMGGAFGLTLNDGTAFIDCGPLPEFDAGSIICPPGTNGFAIAGDIDGDGVRDDGFHFSFTQVIPASSVLEGRPDLIRLFAAPQSDLERPLADFVDNSVIIFHDYTDFSGATQSSIINYTTNRTYAANSAEGTRQMREVVPGVYFYQFPSRNNPLSPVQIPVRIFPNVEAFPGRSVIAGQSGVRTGLRFSNPTWNNGRVEFDPRAPFLLRWEGVSIGDVNTSTDTLFLSIEDDMGNIIFPPFQDTTPENIRVPFRLPNVLTTAYNVSPFLLPQNTDMELVLSYERNVAGPNSIGITDISVREFRLPLRSVNTFESFMLTGFPPGTLFEDRTAEGDLDGDGASNLLEFALGTDVGDPVSVFNPQGTINSEGLCNLTVLKPAGIGLSISYFIEESDDMVTWRTITADNPEWNLFEDSGQISATSVELRASCFLRLRVVSNNLNEL